MSCKYEYMAPLSPPPGNMRAQNSSKVIPILNTVNSGLSSDAQNLDPSEEQQILNVAAKIKPTRRKSRDYTGSLRKQRSSISVSSFMSQMSQVSGNGGSSIETLINYLTINRLNFSDPTEPGFKIKFEEISVEVLSNSHDPELHRIFKNHGWTGTRFRSEENNNTVDTQSLLQALSNLYLRQKAGGLSAEISLMLGTTDNKGANQILSFCPNALLSHLNHTDSLDANHSIAFNGACMLADISGFSKFSGSMCSKGVSGLDDLREATNGFLGHIVRIVYEFNGDVISFAGDALICVFVNELRDADGAEQKDEGSDSSSCDTSPRNQYVGDCCYRALQCACALKDHTIRSLSLHIGVSYGEMKLATLGGYNNEWVYLLNGHCVSELAGCINDAGSSEVVASKACYENAMVTSKVRETVKSMKPMVGTMRRSRGSINLGVQGEDLKPIVSSPVGTAGNLLISSVEDESTTPERRSLSFFLGSQDEMEDPKEKNRILVERAAMFVPRPILSAIYSDSLEHIGELRQVTTMFLSLDSYSPVTHEDPVTLQPFFRLAQEVLYESGGFLRQFLVDDKGCVLIAMWGMPSFTYANNCSRAVYCAVSLSRRSDRELGHKCSIGIATGNVFCGTIGAAERRDFAGIGTDVNIAARLMSKANGRVLTDQKTFDDLAPTTQKLLSKAERLMLKGMTEVTTPFAFSSDVIPRITEGDESGGNNLLRKQVKATLTAQIDKIFNKANLQDFHLQEKEKMNHVLFTIITGLPGSGKSTAVEYFRRSARKRNIGVVLIKARPGHEGVPYGIMRDLFIELVGEDNFSVEEQQRQMIEDLIVKAFPDAPEVERDRAKLTLEVMLGVEWSAALSTASGVRRSFQIESYTDNTADQEESEPHSRIQSFVGSSVKSAGTSSRGSAQFSTGTLTPGGHNNPYNVMSTDTNALCRPLGDLTYYRVLSVLLRNTRTCIIFEEMDYCDELSWNELNLILLGTELRLAVLITMGSSNGSVNRKPSINKSNSTEQESSKLIMGLQSGSFRHALNKTRKSIEMESPIHSQSPSYRFSGLSVDFETARKRAVSKVNGMSAYSAIIDHENSTVIEMVDLNENEVREILMHTLQEEDISDELVRSVLELSSGNAFWCKSIASFLKERGKEAFERALKTESNPSDVLNILILLRMEKLDLDHQTVLKHASILGDEFSHASLSAITPSRLKPHLIDVLSVLIQHGFLLCVEEFPDVIYSFQNQLIQQSVYGLVPPSDAAPVHLAIAEFMEKQYAKNLRPFYPILGMHYQRSLGNRTLTYKYKIKAADQAICRGAFGDGLKFAQEASTYAVSKAELRVLRDVITRALHDISPTGKQPAARKMRKLSFGGFTALDEVTNRRIAAYLQLKLSTEAALDKLTVNLKLRQRKDSIDSSGEPDILSPKRQPSARLNWQPSYVASRQMSEQSKKKDMFQCVGCSIQ